VTEPEIPDKILLECNVCGAWEREPNEDAKFDSENELL